MQFLVALRKRRSDAHYHERLFVPEASPVNRKHQGGEPICLSALPLFGGAFVEDFSGRKLRHGRTKTPDEKKFIVSLTEQELDDIDGGLSWTIDQMCPSDLWMEPRIKALREKIRRKLKRIRQKEDEK